MSELPIGVIAALPVIEKIITELMGGGRSRPEVDVGQLMAAQAEQTRRMFQEQMAAENERWEKVFLSQNAAHQDVMGMMREEAQRREQVMMDRMEKQDAAIREHHDQQMKQTREMMLEKEREMTKQFEIRMQRATEAEKEKARQRLEEQRKAMVEAHEKQLIEERKSYNEKMRESYKKDNEGELKRIHARKELKMDENKIHIALAGESGAGKSSLLNGLREIRGKDSAGYAAENPVQTKRTSQRAEYHCTKFPDACFHDMRGANDENPTETFFWEKKFFAYDHLLIVINNTINEVHMEIARNAYACSIPFTVVRTKADQDIENEAMDCGKEELNEEERKNLRQNIFNDFKLKAPEINFIPFFYVSSTALKNPNLVGKKIDEDAFLKHLAEQVQYIRQLRLQSVKIK